MSMKKYFTIVTVTVMLIVSGACFAKGKDPDVLLYTKGLELIQRMDLIAESKEYTNLFSNSIELKAIVEKKGNTSKTQGYC